MADIKSNNNGYHLKQKCPEGGEMRNILNETSNIKEHLKIFSYFDEWDESMIEECCNLSKIREYKINELILKNGTNSMENVHFILEGHCNVIQILDLNDFKQSENLEVEILAPSKNLKFIKICSLLRLACFNIGEDLNDRMIVSASKTKCLLIPKYWILFKNERLWHRIRFFFRHNIPSAEEVHERYLIRNEFSAYGKTLLNESLSKSKKSRINQDFNIPYHMRLNGQEIY